MWLPSGMPTIHGADKKLDESAAHYKCRSCVKKNQLVHCSSYFGGGFMIMHYSLKKKKTLASLRKTRGTQWHERGARQFAQQIFLSGKGLPVAIRVHSGRKNLHLPIAHY